jgi:hypothetical protein
VSVTDREAEPGAAIYPPPEALRHARPLPPPEHLADEALSEEEWERFQEALAET